MTEDRPRPPAPQSSFAKRLVREPLLHFLLAGLALFAVYQALNRGPAPRDPKRIELTASDLRRLETAWTALWQRPPTPEELQNLIENEVREEILYREALALGLDKGDSIVKRRLVQKMDFLAEDPAALRDPGPGEVRAWYEQNRKRFELPPRASFRQLYFSSDKRQEHARQDAEAALDDLAGMPAEADGANLGDPMMFQAYYGNRTPEEVAGIFGSGFAEGLFQLPPGSWEGPIESGYGWHLVRVDSLTSASVPAFEEIEPQVRSEWLDEQRSAARRQAYEKMRAGYQVILPPEGKR